MQTLRLAPYGVDEVRRGAELVREAEVARRSVRQPRGASISIRDLRKSYGGLDVLTGIDLEIPAGQFVAIVGRSGCGKSTLLRLLAGLEAPDTGTIDFGDGERLAQQGAYGGLRVMFQEPRLLPWSRVLSNVEVGLGRERRGADARDRALAALKAVGLTEKGGQWPSILSGGQKQRVALARALVGHPRILAFDEPLGALDALTRISMQKLLGRVWREQGFTAVLVTHDVAEAIVLADRVLLIEHGRIALDLDIAIKRPRERGSAEVAALEGRILKALFRDGEDA